MIFEGVIGLIWLLFGHNVEIQGLKPVDFIEVQNLNVMVKNMDVYKRKNRKAEEPIVVLLLLRARCRYRLSVMRM